jgi:uroporphyrinogen-III synthase
MNLRCALVTRPRAQGVAWQQRLITLGVEAELLPLIGIAPAPDPAALRDWFATLTAEPAALVMFVSPNAASGLFDSLSIGWRWPDGTLAAATGPGTVAVLRAAGLPEASIVAPPEEAAQFDSESLWAVLEPRGSWPGKRVVIVRGDGGRDWLATQLRAAGARVEFVQSYARRAPELNADEQRLLQRAQADPARFAWLLSSSEAVDHLQALAPSADWSTSVALASHPRIAESARRRGFGQVVEVRPTPEAVAEALGTLCAPAAGGA